MYHLLALLYSYGGGIVHSCVYLEEVCKAGMHEGFFGGGGGDGAWLSALETKWHHILLGGFVLTKSWRLFLVHFFSLERYYILFFTIGHVFA